MAKIMAVDDSPSIRKMVALTLKTAGHEVLIAEDGDEAYEMAQKEDSVDLVVTDLYMPKVNGLELVEKLRGLDSYKYIPLLFLTTESGVEMKKKGKEAGATGWIVKPFAPESLLATINKVL